jgi:hypothetical protein
MDIRRKPFARRAVAQVSAESPCAQHPAIAG